MYEIIIGGIIVGTAIVYAYLLWLAKRRN